MLKKVLVVIFLVFFSLQFIYGSVWHGQESDLIKLERFTPPESITLEGKIIVLDEFTLGFGQPGQTQTIIESGTETEGAIYNRKGEIVRQGTLVAQQYTGYTKPAYEAAKIAYENAKLDLEQAKVDYQRNEILLNKNAISKKEYLSARTAYLKSEKDLQKSYQDLSAAKSHYEANFLFAPFNGIVTNIFQYPDNWYDNFKEVATILSLDPVAIKIQIPLDLCDDIDFLSKEPVIYCPGDNEIIKNWIMEWGDVEKEKIFLYFMLNNKKVSFYNNLPEEYKKLPTFTYKARVINFNQKTKTLAVPVDALFKDKNGNEYVWKITPKELGTSGAKYKTYIAQKVYVKTNDKIKLFSTTRFIELQDTGSLKAYDNIIWELSQSSQDLEDNQIILGDPQGWLYYPEEEVHITFPLLTHKEGFYIPVDAISVDRENNRFVTLENGKKVQVNIEGSFAGFRAVSGEGLKEGTKIIARPNNVNYITKKLIEKINNEPKGTFKTEVQP